MFLKWRTYLHVLCFIGKVDPFAERYKFTVKCQLLKYFNLVLDANMSLTLKNSLQKQSIYIQIKYM